MSPEVRAAFGKIFSDYEVDIVFAGHCHVYGRSNPIKIGEDTAISALDFSDTPGGTVYSIAGTTGPKFYAVSTNAVVHQYFPFNAGQSVISPGGMYLNVNVSAEKLTVTANKLNGTVVDTYEVPAKR
jgi:hypothetical protein